MPDLSPETVATILSDCLLSPCIKKCNQQRHLPLNVSDWNSIIKTARRHRMGPLLYRRFRNHPNVPDDTLNHLERMYATQAARHERLSEVMVSILDLFLENGIGAIPFKGPALASLLYEDTALRQYDDLDFIIDRADLKTAKDLLVADGYEEITTAPEAAQPAMVRAGGAYILKKPDADWQIDLSSSIGHEYFSFRLPLDQLRSACIAVRLREQSVFTVSLEHHFILLSVHGAKHMWSRHAWIGDIAALMTREHAPDWNFIINCARRQGGLRMVLIAISLVHRTCGISAPAVMQALLNADPHATRLADEILARFASNPDWSPGDDLTRLRFHIGARERVRDRLRYLLVRGFKPSYNDWRSVPLPVWLFPLYYVLRPMRLAWRAVSRRPGDT